MKVAVGQFQSCLIGRTDASSGPDNVERLHVWGLNANQQLGLGDQKRVVEVPTVVKLEHFSREYEATNVVCGPSYIAVVGKINHPYEALLLKKGKIEKSTQRLTRPLFQVKRELIEDTGLQNLLQSVKELKKTLKRVIQREGSLDRCFFSMKMSEDAHKAQESSSQAQDNNQFYRLKVDKKEEKTRKNSQIRFQVIQKKDFLKGIKRLSINLKVDLNSLTDSLFQGQQFIALSQLEDFALEFQQDEAKLFLFGKLDKNLVGFGRENSKDRKESRFDDDGSDSVEEETKLEGRQVVVTRPVAIQFPRYTSQIKQIACGVAHMLALSTDGQLFSWGQGDYGALGFGNHRDEPYPRLLQIMYGQRASAVTQVACGNMHSLCLTDDQRVYAWGCGSQGRLGLGSRGEQLTPKQIIACANLRVSQISAGESHNAVVTKSGKLYTWGNGSYGRLGNGFETDCASPELVEDLMNTHIVRAYCGAFHTYALSNEGQIYAFGQDKYGRLGLASSAAEGSIRVTPVQVMPYRFNVNKKGVKELQKTKLVSFLQIATFLNHTLAMTRSGHIYSWGYNGSGVLARNGPETIPLQLGSEKKSIPQFYTAALHDAAADEQDVSVEQRDQMGTSSLSKCVEVIQVVTGNFNSAILTNNGEVHICGDNRYGQLGLDSAQLAALRQTDLEQQSAVLFQQVGLGRAKVRAIACGGEHLLAMTANDELFGWGKNNSGQLGLGFISDKVSQPAQVLSLRGQALAQVQCGPDYSAVVTSLRKLLVTGSLEGGKLGLGKAWRGGFIQEFKVVPRLNSVRQVACGANHMMAICSRSVSGGSGVFAWGANWRGQLGLGNKDASFVPREISLNEDTFEEVRCGRDFSLGLSTKSRKVYVWGNFKYVGLTLSQDLETPFVFKPLDGKRIASIACSDSMCAAVSENNDVFVWGLWFNEVAEQNQSGKLEMAIRRKSASQSSNSSSFSATDSQSDSNSENSSDSDQLTGRGKKGGGALDSVQNYPVQMLPLAKGQDKKAALTVSLGANHGCLIGSKDRLLYCWGSNESQQLGISRKTYEAAGTDSLLMKRLHAATLNNKLIYNRKRIQEGLTGEVPQPDQKAEVNEKQQDIAPSLLNVPTTPQASKDVIKEEPVRETKLIQQKEQFEIEEKSPKTTPGINLPDDFLQKQDSAPTQTPNKIQEEEFKANEERLDSSVSLFEEDIQDVLPATSEQQAKPVYLAENVDIASEEKHYMLQQLLTMEEKNGSDERAMFEIDKKIQSAFDNLLKELESLPYLEAERTKLKIQIKNSLLQRVQEKPLNVPETIDWNRFDSKHFLLRQKKKMMKNYMKEALLFVHMHPCYLINLFQTGQLETKQMLKFVKLVYPCHSVQNGQISQEDEFSDHSSIDSSKVKSSHQTYLPSTNYQTRLNKNPDSLEQSRVNFLQISLIKGLLQQELAGVKSLEQVDFLKQTSLVGKLFYRIFKSQRTNVDTISIIGAQFVNMFLLKIQEQGVDENNRQAQELKQKQEAMQTEGQNVKDIHISKKITDICIKFVQQVVSEFIDNTILTKNTTFLARRKKHFLESKQQNYLKFSPEIVLLVEIISSQLRQLPFQSRVWSQEERIAQKILPLLISKMLRKVAKNYEEYLFPFLKQAKMNYYLVESMENMELLFDEVLMLFNAYLSGSAVYKESHEQHISELNNKLFEIQQQTCVQFLKKVVSYEEIPMRLLSVKNFEFLLLHSLNSQDFIIQAKLSDLRDLFAALDKHREQVSIVNTGDLDRLFNVLKQLRKRGLRSVWKVLPSKIQLKLKTRLLSKGSTTSSCCPVCRSVLGESFNIQEHQAIIEEYEPEDRQTLVALYSQVLRQIPDLDPQQNIEDQIMRYATAIKKSTKYKLLELLTLFFQNFDSEVKQRIQRWGFGANSQNVTEQFERLVNGQSDKAYILKTLNMAADDDEQDTTEIQVMLICRIELLNDLLSQAQEKINKRRSHITSSQILLRRIHLDLAQTVKSKLQWIQMVELFSMRLTYLNVNMGLANSELKPLINQSDQVTRMQAIVKEKSSHNLSQTLFKVLPDSQKMQLRAVVRKSARELLETKTITRVVIHSLQPLINQCTLVFSENEDRSVILKLLLTKKGRQSSFSCLQTQERETEQLLLLVCIDPSALLELRKESRQVQVLLTNTRQAIQAKDNNKLRKLAQLVPSSNLSNQTHDTNRKGNKESSQAKEPIQIDKEQLVAEIEKLNRVCFKDALEFDRAKLIAIVNEMLRNRFAYLFRSHQSPGQILTQNQGHTHQNVHLSQL